MTALYDSYSSAGDPGGGRDDSKFYAFDAKSHADAINTNTAAIAAIVSGTKGATVATSESTTSTSYTDLTTTTDTVTVTIGASGMALVLISMNWTTSGGGFGPMSYALSGANTVAATDAKAIAAHAQVVAAISGYLSGAFLETGLTAGSTVFKAKYKSNAGVSQTWSNRRIAVIPFP